jgi:LysR family transcriptional regulator for bpeEF and oprC
MDRFEAMEIFTRVVEANSFTKVSESLDLPRAKVSRTIQALEEHVGVRLLNRSTRQVSVTEDGALFYDRCVRILAEVADAESSLSNKRAARSASIRPARSPVRCCCPRSTISTGNTPRSTCGSGWRIAISI